MRRAAEILCRHHKDVEQIRFAMEVDGNPGSAPDNLFRRYFEENKFSQHEAFFPGDVIGVTCVVPSSIDDDDFRRLLTYAGKYCGMSPGHPNDFGFYVVESIIPTMPKQPLQRKQRKLEADDEAENKKGPPPAAIGDDPSSRQKC